LVDAYAAILDKPNIAQEGEVNQGTFEISRLNEIHGVGDGIRICVQAPSEDLKVKAMEDRGGVLLGDIVVGKLSGTSGKEAQKFIRIDVPDEEGVGRICLEVDVPVSK
jgi:hypothetical protein